MEQVSDYTILLLSFLRFPQFVLSFLCIAVTDFSWNGHRNNEFYVICVSIWTLFTTLFLVFAPMYLSASAFHKGVMVGVEFLTNLFWFTAFISLAVGGEYDYGDSMKAPIAFAAAIWVLFVITSIIVATLFFGQRRVYTEITHDLDSVVGNADCPTSDIPLDRYSREDAHLISEGSASRPSDESTPPAYDGPAYGRIADGKPFHSHT
ncbi:hypothetical protein POJ06DRAFT_262770 [Lipomyces tetrasporus]|uniref:MARVEL domain-containing protein n=1 Tax=Lipomyces tetrasporus TaxID=54092 RepID=A0AAD7QKZ9_9ASCO|nr:uncharacterized protein POJ06DRAFT_262770 [Lipomyces tetrasporus]KAJ8097212.1 hypothetical protein POJ06DRAFT_262770 [Lipomyces tetrasporus]